MRSGSSPRAVRRITAGLHSSSCPSGPGFLDAAHHLEPIEAGKHHVQHNEIGVPGLDGRDRIGSGECLTGLIARALQVA